MIPESYHHFEGSYFTSVQFIEAFTRDHQPQLPYVFTVVFETDLQRALTSLMNAVTWCSFFVRIWMEAISPGSE